MRETTTRRRGAALRQALAVATAGALALTAACSGGGPGTSAVGTDGDVVLRFSWWGNEERARITNEAVEAFEAENPGIDVQTEFVDFGSYFDRLSTSVAANDEPDVITLGGAYPREYGDRGVLLDLAAVAARLDLGRIDESALAGGRFDGVQYGVPTGVNTFGLIVDPGVFEQAGVALPDDDTWDWDDLAGLAIEISRRTPDGVYGLEDPTTPDVLDLYASQYTGTGLYAADGELAIDTETVEDWFDLTTGLRDAGGTPGATLTAELSTQTSPEQQLIGQGLAAMKFGWSNNLGAYREASGADLRLLRVPGETRHERAGMWLQASQLYTISARSAHPEEAAALIDFLVSSEAAADRIGSDRGVPADPAVREHLAPSLTESQAIEFAFIDRVSPLIDPAFFVVGPTGSSESVAILQRLNQSVLFDRMDPAQGAQAFVDELSAAISR